ncbi:MAG: ATP-binding cassette domain-containing protein [Planctomycetes bacterium]|nr:ATP-binding cassette domain-containing protein [Planctomycetota bacterium]
MSTATAPIRSATATGDRRPVVACQRLSKVFKDFWMRDRARAVDGIDFVVNEREVFGLLGPNGSGKSTAIKLILGLLKPTSGRVSVFGKPPTDVATKRRVGYLPEESYLYPFLNARETLDYYGKLFGLDHKVRQRRIDELLDMVGLTHAQHRQVREYSKGMQRRIGIAQALINDPDLLILDEPTTGLDPIGTRQVKDLILDLGRRGKSIILSSHLLGDVEDVVDRMVILYGGKIRGEGTCEQLLAATDRTTIEADALDEGTLAEIDEVIRRRSGGLKSVRRVAAPRQKLEELFLGIVERARTEQTATSGATQGGATAAFLRAADRAEDAESVIDRLMSEDEPAPVASEAPGRPEQPASPSGPDSSVIDDLVRDEPETPPSPGPARRPAPGAPAEEDVDDSVIGSLLDQPADDEDAPGDDPRNRGGDR